MYLLSNRTDVQQCKINNDKQNIYNRLEQFIKPRYKICLRHELPGTILSETNLHNLTILKYCLQVKLTRKQRLQIEVDNLQLT